MLMLLSTSQLKDVGLDANRDSVLAVEASREGRMRLYLSSYLNASNLRIMIIRDGLDNGNSTIILSWS